MHKGEFSFSLCREECVGFVTPVYFWGLPDIVVRFINQLTITGLHHNFIYHVVAFGTTTGQAHYMMQELLKNKGLWLDAKYIVRMVDVWTPIFDVSDHEKCMRITEEAEKSKHCQDNGNGCGPQDQQLRLSASPPLAGSLVLPHLRKPAQDKAFPSDEGQVY